MSESATEIEQTLRIARDQVEAHLARYRVWLFAAAGLISALVGVVRLAFGQPSTFLPAAYFVALEVYAVAVLRDVRQRGARDFMVFASLALDILASVAVFVVVRIARPDASGGFASFIAAPGVLMVLLINTLRAHRQAALFGAAVGAAALAVVLPLVSGFHPAEIGVVATTLVTGVIGAAAARQRRTDLDTFARLSLLRRYLPPAAVERVLSGAPDAAVALGGRLATVTLIATDLRGFTTMSEKLAPTEVVRQLNAYHGAMLEQIDLHGGALDKFIGDGALVVFGLDDAHRDAGAHAAVSCARAMLVALEALNRARASERLAPLRMGIGVHTGSVVAGNIGAVGRRLEFTVIGDAVNTVARLEGMTKDVDRSILVSVETARRLPGDVGLRSLTSMHLRGREEELEVFGLD
jgi:adenylate cyclase